MAPRDSDQHLQQEGAITAADRPSSYPGIIKYPTNRDVPLRLAEDWMDSKRLDDNIGNDVWRIHDKLYNLESYIRKHPGGPDWIDMSRGQDITEAFESAHMVNPEIVEKMLQKFYVGEATTPRISPFTFKEDGFFKTLKRKSAPVLKKIGSGPTRSMVLMQDSLASFFLIFGALGAIYDSWTLSIISGLFLAVTEVGAHNFFHLRDSWRRFYFDLGLGDSYAWRITHFFSHHLYPNTVMDIELTLTPTYELMPTKPRSWWQKYLPPIYSHFLYCFSFWIDFVKRGYYTFKGTIPIRPENFIVIMELMTAMIIAPTPLAGAINWVVVHTSASFFFMEIGQNGQHHHPNIFHDGDEARPDPDFGLGQIDATRDRIENVFQNQLMILVTFGNHTLHHLFPTVCHSKLPLLEPIFVETLQEFKEEWIKFPHWELYLGLYKQLANTEPATVADLRRTIKNTNLKLKP